MPGTKSGTVDVTPVKANESPGSMRSAQVWLLKKTVDACAEFVAKEHTANNTLRNFIILKLPPRTSSYTTLYRFGASLLPAPFADRLRYSEQQYSHASQH